MNSLSSRCTFRFDAIEGSISSLRSLCFFIPCRVAICYTVLQTGRCKLRRKYENRGPGSQTDWQAAILATRQPNHTAWSWCLDLAPAGKLAWAHRTKHTLRYLGHAPSLLSRKDTTCDKLKVSLFFCGQNCNWTSLICGQERRLTRTSGSHARFLGSVGDAEPTMPIGGPRKLSQTSRKRDSSASLHAKKKTKWKCNYFSKDSLGYFHIKCQNSTIFSIN